MSLKKLSRELVSGCAFGSALLTSGVYLPVIIKEQMLFANNHMLMVFLSASASSAVVLYAARRAQIWHGSPRAESSLGLFAFDGNVLGGLCVGVGMATTGACPGTALVQAGTGLPGGAAVVVGGVAGALAFLSVKSAIRARGPTVNTSRQHTGTDSSALPIPQRTLDIPTALNVPSSTALLLWVPLCLSAVALAGWLDMHRALERSISPRAIYGGPLIGLAQATTILFAGHPVGVSAVYEDLARLLRGFFADKVGSTTDLKVQPDLTTSVCFAAGIVLSAALLRPFLPMPGAVDATGIYSSAEMITQACGGAIMVFGARLAGGCTSGHGISGLSMLSISSLATTASIFIGGILTAQVFNV